MKIILRISLILLVLSSCEVDPPSLAIVTGEEVPVLAHPYFEDQNDTGIRLDKGDTVQILEESNHTSSLVINEQIYTTSWYKVKFAYGTGWLYGAYIQLLAASGTMEEKYIPPPPRLQMAEIYKPEQNWLQKQREKGTRWWEKNFGTASQKELIQLIEACDFANPVVRNKAVSIAGTHSGEFNLGQVCDLYDYANERWGYVNDPPTYEYVAKASETIGNARNGDCDDYAVLMAALVVAIGGEARISYAYTNNSAHAFTEVLIGYDEDLVKYCIQYLTARYDTDYLPGFRQEADGGYWMNLDWFSEYPAGTYYDYNSGIRFDILREQFQQI